MNLEGPLLGGVLNVAQNARSPQASPLSLWSDPPADAPASEALSAAVPDGGIQGEDRLARTPDRANTERH